MYGHKVFTLASHDVHKEPHNTVRFAHVGGDRDIFKSHKKCKKKEKLCDIQNSSELSCMSGPLSRNDADELPMKFR